MNQLSVNSENWLAFELNILRRLEFKTVILPSGNETKLGSNLKRRNVRVQTNDLLQSDWIRATAEIENNSTNLSQEDIQIILEDAYVPRHRLQNPVLLDYFNESDAWWFDNVRQNTEKLSNPTAGAVALKIALETGDYVLSFDKLTRELRQPLSNVFQKLYSIQTPLYDNYQKNSSINKNIVDFIAENSADLMFLRLPYPRRSSLKEFLGQLAWREEWIRGNTDFWENLEQSQSGNFGSRIESKTQYFSNLEKVLQTASHIPHWTIFFVETGFVSTQEIVETINQVRRVETIFSKDFSELTGTKAVIITA